LFKHIITRLIENIWRDFAVILKGLCGQNGVLLVGSERFFYIFPNEATSDATSGLLQLH